MIPRRVLILDVETGGVDPAKDPLVELGLARWSVEHRALIRAASILVAAPSNDAATVNGIPPALLPEGQTADFALDVARRWAEGCDAVLAHNGEDFDKLWTGELGGLPWIDSAWDIDWPKPCGGRRLQDIALAHGLAVLAAHRALTDCLLLAQLLERVAELPGVELGALLERAMRPKVKVISMAPYEEKDKVKEHGFRWSDEDRWWFRRLPAEDVAALPFPAAPEESLVWVVSLAPFGQKDLVRQNGFQWDGDAKIWTKRMPAADVPGLPFRARIEAPRPRSP